MKKVLMGIVSFALVLFTGVALVGCGEKHVSYALKKEGTQSSNWTIETGANNERIIVSKNAQGNAEIAEGVKLILELTNSGETSYVVTKVVADKNPVTTESDLTVVNNKVILTVKYTPSTVTADTANSNALTLKLNQGSGKTGKDTLVETVLTIRVKLVVPEAE